ncbi:MAG: putative acyltransferase [Solidesulfovibrio magneticus str. Maddingley MBC34]|uniref:Putative acyltransferase n=1 Tax=Solidesulfovibrio magneticus str. Maddingley MBC34 TaxID=1206767 RepID=K6FQW6_9BACT|nr:MAG: putative acyltransferase [Solidesulfovibrio magneticus str. Maddingley MBC34]
MMYSIQILRIIGMLMIVYIHVGVYMTLVSNVGDSAFHVIPDAFMCKAFIFFSISGFIMAFLIDIGYRNFLVRRILRVYPTFLIACVLAIALRYLLFGQLPGKDMFLAMTLMPVGFVDYPLKIEWTLIYEVCYYLIITPFAFPKTRRYFVPFLFVWLGVIGIAYFASGITAFYVLPPWKRLFVSYVNIYFITGALAYHAAKRLRFDWWPAYVLAILASAAVTVATSEAWKLEPYNMKQLATWSLCTAVTLVSLVKLENHFQAPWVKAIGQWGDYAYAVYLTHALVVGVFFSWLVYRYGWQLDNRAALIAVGLILVVGYGLGRLDAAVHGYFKRKFS